MSQSSFYWHDYETFGIDPARDRPAQFAGLRTDEDFNIIGDPLVIYSQLAADSLPHPEACLVTGITPQLTHQKGLPEAEFIAKIHAEFSQANTCSVGYNSIRFDDEFTRYTLYRNFFDPYAREWQNGNSRWDLIDIVRACYALRPEGIEWPKREDGTPSFRLEELTRANGIDHEAAHDALSDVQATIALARLIKQKQPQLFDYFFRLRNKHEVSKLLNVRERKPVLHTSGMFSSDFACTSIVMPLAMHPSNKNGVICVDLRADPSPLMNLDAETIKQRLYTAAADLPEGVERIPLKTIHINKCPVVGTTKLIDEAVEQRIKIDKLRCFQHYQQLSDAVGLSDKVVKVFSEQSFPVSEDPDCQLYSGGFFGSNDKNTMARIRSCSSESLISETFYFEDKRLDEMLFRYKGRNYPSSLSVEEKERWLEYCYHRITDVEYGANLQLDSYVESVEGLLAQSPSERNSSVLLQLLEYADRVLVQ